MLDWKSRHLRQVRGRGVSKVNDEKTTATEHFRQLLDKRGVEWRRTPHYSSESMDNETVFCGIGIEWLASDHLNGRLGLRALKYEVTPEQAVEATLGSGVDSMTDADLAEHGLVRLPVDGDMVTIRVGDTLDGYGKTIEIVEMRYGRGGWVLISRDGGGYAGTFAFEHHHEPTVEY